MANPIGYSQTFTDIPELWMTGGQVAIGATGAPTYTLKPSGLVSAVTRLGTGQYKIVLAEAWYALISADIKSEIAASQSPAYVSCQVQSDTVGVTGTFPQSITFQFNVAGTPTEIPSGSSFRFMLFLKRSSA